MQIINEQAIFEVLANVTESAAVQVREILQKAQELNGLNFQDVAVLMSVSNQNLLEEIFETAKQIKESIYGRRLVLFAPLYISNLCSNECQYCAFRESNVALKRCSLTQEQIAHETKLLVDSGQKRILLVSGESDEETYFDYLLKSIETVYAVKSKQGEIRRLNVNVAPLSTEQFKDLKQAQIGTYQLFQETYHQQTYQAVHVKGIKSHYDWRLEAIDRAMEAGIDDVGIGVLFGLYDWRFEVLALMQHAEHLNKTFGVGPHTISVPRLEPAFGSVLSEKPPSEVSDEDFKKLIAILRIAVPYTGLILSTRETPQMRRDALALGISQISAGSRTNPGGYGDESFDASQFSLGDHRSLDEVICDVASMGYIPSFCTACYRLGRTGHDFMDLAKPGDIKDFCSPNALATFQEYLEDYASAETKKVGEQLIQIELNKMPQNRRKLASQLIERIKSSERDVFI